MNGLEHLAALEADATRLVELVALADQSAPVPTCPGWTVADVVEHVGTLYRWSAAHVATAAPARLSPRSLDLGLTEAGPSPAWLAEGVGPMLATFSGADPELVCWGWGGDRRARFWPRRMLFETVVHRADAAFALDVEPVVDADVAVEGIDELLSNLPHAAVLRARPGRAAGRRRDHRAPRHGHRRDVADPPRPGRLRLGLVGRAGRRHAPRHRGGPAAGDLSPPRRPTTPAASSARATSPCSTASSPTPSSDPEGVSDGVRPDRVADRDHRADP